MRSGAPSAVADHLQLGVPKRKATRGAFNPSPEVIADAKQKYEAARAALKLAFTGRDLDPAIAGWGVSMVRRLEQALAVYVAVTSLGVAKKVLAQALAVHPREIQRWCRFVEAWREAPVAGDAIERVERALPRVS